MKSNYFRLITCTTKQKKANKTCVIASLHYAFCIVASAIEGKTEEEIEMMKVMGFGGFDTTKV